MSSFRKRLMMSQGGGGGAGNEVSSAESVVGDVCVYGISEGRLMIINNWSASKYPIDKYSPVGIVVVPGSHGHYADGKCAIMSLNYMRCDTPTIGGEYQGMYWGVYSQDISSLPNLDQVPYVGRYGNVGANIIGQTNRAFLPSDHPQFTALANPYDTKTNYYEINSSCASSPYNNDGIFNPNYSSITSPSSTANCLADFDGYNNTKRILKVRGSKNYSTWKPTTNNQNDYPAASCCDMYYTVGTSQKEWYLPSAGELGYVCVRIKTINDTISKLISAGAANASVIRLYNHCSSSEYSNYCERRINFSSGEVYYYDKYSDIYVRAFRLV